MAHRNQNSLKCKARFLWFSHKYLWLDILASSYSHPCHSWKTLLDVNYIFTFLISSSKSYWWIPITPAHWPCFTPAPSRIKHLTVSPSHQVRHRKSKVWHKEDLSVSTRCLQVFLRPETRTKKTFWKRRMQKLQKASERRRLGQLTELRRSSWKFKGVSK